jgi:hypothetical protein
MENSTLSSSTPSPIQELREAVYRLLKYAISDANSDVDEKIISKVVPILQKDETQFTADDEKNLWSVYNQLSRLVTPATNESLWFKEQMELDDRAQVEGKTAHHSSLVAKAYKNTYITFKWIGYVFGVIFFMLQSYTVFLSDSLNQVDLYYAGLTKVEEQIVAVKQAKPDILPCSSPLKELNAQQDELLLEIDSHYRVIQKMSHYFWGYFYSSATLDYYTHRLPQCQEVRATPIPYASIELQPPQREDLGQQAKAERLAFLVAAKSMQHLCNYLLLPMIMGILGSIAYVIRSILDSFSQASLTFSSTRRGSMRVYLGALLGLISGVVIVPDIKAIQEISYAPLVWAFLMGYSVEFAFTLFDALIARGRSALQALRTPPPDLARENTTEDKVLKKQQ